MDGARPHPDAAIIVLNFRTPDYTVECLESLARERASFPGFTVVLVDNASGDDSVPRIQAWLDAHGRPPWIEFRPQAKNHGFAGGNNVAVREVLAWPQPPRYVLLLNSDTVVHPGCLAASVARMDADPGIGLYSCMLFNRDGTVQNVCRKFPHPLRETFRALGLPYLAPALFGWADLEDKGWDRRTTAREVEWIGGAFMLIRREVLEKIGSLDEGFFFYGEDCEFCHRAWKAGYRVFFDPAGSITHYGGGSSDATRMRNRRREILTWKARFLTQRKCYGPLAAAWIRGVYIFSFASRKLLFTLLGRRGTPAYEGVSEGLAQLTGSLDPDQP